MSEKAERALDGVNRAVFDAYDREVERVADAIRPHLPPAGVRDGTLDGREWCREHDIPESVFADAINYHLEDEADYGISPMYPWSADYGGDTEESVR